MDVQGDNMMETAMLQLINDGHIKWHLKRATLAYETKRDFFGKVITEHLSDKINFINQKAVSHFGLHQSNQQIWFLYRNYFYRKVFKLYRPQILVFDQPVTGLLLGYSSLDENKFEQGVSKLARLL